MKYAVVEIGGRQFAVSEGQSLEVDRLNEEAGKSFNIPDPLLFVDGEGVRVGAPFVGGVKIRAKVLEHKLGEKTEIRRFRAKSRYRRKRGHRQPISLISIEKIGG